MRNETEAQNSAINSRCAFRANERREPHGLHRHPARRGSRRVGDLIGSAKRCCVLHSAEKAGSGPAGGVDPDLRESPGKITAPARKVREVSTQVGASRAFARMYAR